MLLTFEFGNLPMYVVYGVLKSSNSEYWHKTNYVKILIILEFVWYVFFRCMVPVKLLFHIENKLYYSVVFGFIIISIK